MIEYKSKRITLIVVSFLMMWACEKATPVADATPISDVDFAFLQASNKLFVSANVSSGYQGGTLDSAMVLWQGISASNSGDSLRLFDDGTHGDILSKDQIYSRKFLNDSALKNTIPTTAKDSIFFTILGLFSGKQQTVESIFVLGNIRPKLGSVFVPDTVTRPTANPDPNITNTVKFSVTASVSDPNGLDDIQRVFFLTYHVGLDSMMNGGNPILLYDDGTGEGGSGDLQKGDGSYTMIISMTENATVGTYYWTFKAQDFSNAYSDTVKKVLVVQ
ncbi:MAG: hypothetical protein QF794_00930 [Candidatus Marinimicrobia bacterium]|jgi:hypothetical protein|nr:hypothetical protein [Candidatus Neomarinimicrobiota bacterium]